MENNTINVVKESVKLLIAYLDSEMEKHPSRRLADVSNKLQEVYDTTE